MLVFAGFINTFFQRQKKSQTQIEIDFSDAQSVQHIITL